MRGVQEQREDRLSEVLALCRANFASYCAAVYPSFEVAAHIRAVIGKLEQVEQGKITRLQLALPPRHGKSLTATQLFAGWYLGKHPEEHLIVAAYGEELADTFGRRTRAIMASDMHRAIFPASVISADANAANRFNLVPGGSYRAVGRGTGVTGHGCSLLIADDVTKDSDEARSESVQRSIRSWYSDVLYTRLAPGGRVIVIGSRWVENDLPGWLQKQHADEGWQLLSLPALAGANDPLGRTENAALWPSHYPVETLELIRRAIGSQSFAALYQGSPRAPEGNVWKASWLRYYREVPEKFQRIVQSWDCASKTGTQNDYSVGTTWGVTVNGYYLLALFRDKLEFPELKRQIASQAAQWKPAAILIEDSSAGQQAVQELKAATRYAVLPIKPDRDKLSRALAITPAFEAGRVHFPEGANFVPALVDELLGFPNCEHDDQTDSLVQALNWLNHHTVPEVRVCFWTGSGRSMSMSEFAGMDAAAWELWRSAR